MVIGLLMTFFPCGLSDQSLLSEQIARNLVLILSIILSLRLVIFRVKTARRKHPEGHFKSPLSFVYDVFNKSTAVFYGLYSYRP